MKALVIVYMRDGRDPGEDMGTRSGDVGCS